MLFLSSEAFYEAVHVHPSCVRLVAEYGESLIDDSFLGKTGDEIHTRVTKLKAEALSRTPDFNSIDTILHERQTVTRSSADLIQTFERQYPELEHYTEFASGQPQLRDQALNSMLCTIWLIKDRYDDFTACQNKSKMSTKLWSRLVTFTRWANLDGELLDASLVLLAVRNFGKLRALERLLPSKEVGIAEITLCNLLRSNIGAIPSFERVSPEIRQLIIDAAELSRYFHLGQLLQAENIPSAFSNLKIALDECPSDTDKLLRVFLFTMLCTMSGAMGMVSMEGSAFMNEERGWPVFMALEAIGDLSGDPVERYWLFIKHRVRTIGIESVESFEEKALARLSCLTRRGERPAG